MSRIPGVRRTVGTAAGATAALALLTGGCVFAALTGPAISLHTRTQALQQTLARFPSTTKTVQATADWADFTQTLHGGQFSQFGQELGRGTLVSSTSQLARGFAALPVPLGAGAWVSLGAKPALITSGAAASAYAALPPKMVVEYRDPLAGHGQLVAGTYTPGTVPAGAVAVAATVPTAARFGLHPGSRLTLSTPDGPVALLVTAIVRERAPASAFWSLDPIVAAPSLENPLKLPFWEGGVIADPGALAAMQGAFTGPGLAMQWTFPVAVGGVTADQAQGLYDALNRAVTTLPPLTGALADGAGALTVTSPLLGDLSLFLGTQAAVETVLLLLFVSLILVGAAVIVLAARMIVERRDGELGMLRARGGSVRQVASLMLGAAVIAAAPGALLGAGLAIAVLPGGTAVPVAGWFLAGIAVLAALAGPPLIAAWRYRKPAPAGNPARITTAETRPRVAWRRPVAEIAAVAASAAGLVVLHDQGVPASGGIDLYLAVIPVLVAIPVVLLMLRLYPLVIQGLLKLSARRAGATGFVALSGAARSSLAGVLPAFALVLALSLAAFAGMVSQGVARGEIAASWQATGADVLITADTAAGPVTPAAVGAIAAVRGVRHAAQVWSTNWTTPYGQPVVVAAVDPAGYAALVADTPFPAVPAGSLRGAPGGRVSSGATVPVLASPGAAAALGAGVTRLTSLDAMGPVQVRVAGILGATPAQPAGGAFMVMPLEALPGPAGRPVPNMVLVTGSAIDHAQLSAVAAGVLPDSVTTFRTAVLASLAGSPLQHGAGLIIALTVGAAAAFGLFIMILGLALGSAERELTLARMAVLGHDRATGLILAETMPTVLAAVVAGIVCAVLLPRAIGSSIDLSAFTGTSAPVQFQPDVLAVGLPAAVAIMLALAALAAQARALRRRDITGMLRAH